MNWRNETWRKLYVREEGSFAALSFTAKALAGQLLKICDASGRIFPRDGEDIRDSICFRLGMTTGERRVNRPAVDVLLKDEYLVHGDSGSVRIRNFNKPHGWSVDVEEAGETSGPVLLGNEATTTPARAPNEQPTGRAPTDNEPGTNHQRTENEKRPNSAEARPQNEHVPSVPFLPSVPSIQGRGEPRPPLGIRAQRLVDRFGRIRSAVIPGALPWHAAGRSLFGKAVELAQAIEKDDDAESDVEQTMRMSLEKARESQDPRDGDAAWAFGTWVSRFTDLREELRGRRAPEGTPNKPCDFHARGGNTGRKAPKHEFRRACPECRHLEARAGPRPAGRPETVAELLRGITHGR